MGTARTHTVALIGIDGHLVTIEADIANGLPATILAGLPDSTLREARDRIRAALVNSGHNWPRTKVTISLSPARLPKRGSAYDLPIAIAILAAGGDVPQPPSDTMFLAELGLDGRLRPVPGALPAILAGTHAGIGTVLVAAGNFTEASAAPDVRVIAAQTLPEVVAWLRGGPPPKPPASPGAGTGPRPAAPDRPQPDLKDLLGQPHARMAAEICAAGGHNLSLLGMPAAGTVMLAERLPGILPDLDPDAALELASIYSAAGVPPSGTGLVTRPPFCAPHHTASKAAIVGGSSGIVRPGVASLAHRGVLFLDDAPEFGRDVLEALRQPLETGAVSIARSGICAAFPARFMLVVAARPCPCPFGEARCECGPAVRRRYLGRLSGPLLDRIDVKIRVEPADRQAMLRDRRTAESSAVVAQRVAAARDRAAARLAGTPWRVNAEVPGSELRRSFAPAPRAHKALERATELGQVSGRGADKVVRVAWSIADLAGHDQPGLGEIEAAMGLFRGTNQ
jgi:magnesium chelatase family protein